MWLEVTLPATCKAESLKAKMDVGCAEHHHKPFHVNQDGCLEEMFEYEC
jgi:hypothetical protein